MALPSLRAPIQFGRYQLLHRIGAGGMGEVFLARVRCPSGADRLCVVKKMLSHLSMERSFVERFVDEAKVVVHLSHRNIAQVFEMGEVDGEYFMAMEYVEGKTLSRLAARLRERGERFPLPLALHVAIRVCDALAHAHRKTDASGTPLDLVHRDISPANILVSYRGEVKVIDFGAAQSAIKEVRTAPRVVIGNLAYMSPEHARKKPVDGRADLYSLAVVLWELSAGRQVPTGGDSADRWRRAAYPRFGPPSEHQPDLPADLDRIVMRALSPDRRDRQADAEELRDELQRVLDRIAPQTSQAMLEALMRSHFAQEAAADRRMGAEALGLAPGDAGHDDVTVPGDAQAPAPAAQPAAEHAEPADEPCDTSAVTMASEVELTSPLQPPEDSSELSGLATVTYRPWRRHGLGSLLLVAALLAALGLAAALVLDAPEPPDPSEAQPGAGSRVH